MFGGRFPVRTASVRLPLWAVIAASIGKKLAGLVAAVVTRPGLVAAVTAPVVAVWFVTTREVSRTVLVALVLLVLAGLVGWRLGHPGSFRRLLAWPLRAWWRRGWVYGRFWQPAMVHCGLAKKNRDGAELLPRIVKVCSTGTVDRVTVALLPGQVLTDFGKVADRLAATFEAADCRVRTVPRSRLEARRAVKKGREPVKSTKRVELWFLVADPLVDPVPVFDIPESPDLAGLPVALREDGATWFCRILATHVLIAGVTGAGKGSVVWAIIRALCPLIASRTVELHVIDPKGGMELAAGRRLFTGFCYGRTDETVPAAERTAYELAYAEFLEALVERMQQRQDRLMGHTRQHTAAPGDPAVVVVIDELAALTAYVVDRDAKKRIASALSLLLSQGRAVGFYVIAALQDSRKEVLPDRNLFPTRIALRLAEESEIDQVLGGGARAKGARCDEIPESLPGVAFVKVEGVSEPIRIRFPNTSDTEIDTMANLYTPGTDTARLQVIGPDGQPTATSVGEAA